MVELRVGRSDMHRAMFNVDRWAIEKMLKEYDLDVVIHVITDHCSRKGYVGVGLKLLEAEHIAFEGTTGTTSTDNLGL